MPQHFDVTGSFHCCDLMAFAANNQNREQINGDLKRVIWDSLQSHSCHPFSSPLSKNSRNTVYKLRFANVLGRINGGLKKVIWDSSLQSLVARARIDSRESFAIEPLFL